MGWKPKSPLERKAQAEAAKRGEKPFKKKRVREPKPVRPEVQRGKDWGYRRLGYQGVIIDEYVKMDALEVDETVLKAIEAHRDLYRGIWTGTNTRIEEQPVEEPTVTAEAWAEKWMKEHDN